MPRLWKSIAEHHLLCLLAAFLKFWQYMAGRADRH